MINADRYRHTGRTYVNIFGANAAIPSERRARQILDPRCSILDPPT
jgi:hypothetical protein